MKEHVQEPGIRKWAGDDLVELQNEPLSALQALVEPYAPCILYGCEVSVVEGSTYKLSSGLAAIKGVDAQGIPCVKIVRVPEVAATTLPVYIYLAYETISRVYASNEDKPVAYDYVAKVATAIPEADSYLTITASGGQRLPDTMGITKKLNSDGGEAKDVKVTFAQASSRTLPASGSKLGILMGSIRKWLYDLKALAFKDKVAGSDLDADVVATFNKKVDKKAGYALSKNDFTDALLDKLNGIAANANNYALPLASLSTRGGIKIGYSESSNNRAVKLSSEKAYVNIPNASGSANGLMSASDKAKLDNLDGGAVRFTSLDISMSNANPTGGLFNATDSATLYNQGIRAGDLLFYNINGDMSEFCVGRVLSASSSKVVVSYMDDISIPNQNNRLFPKYNVVSAYSNGLMSSSDKQTLDSLDEDVSDLLKIHPIYVRRIQVSSGGGITTTFSKGVSDINMSVTYSSSPEGLVVKSSGIGLNGFTYIIPLLMGESNGACHIDGNGMKGSFNIRMNPRVAGGTVCIFLFGIK